MKNCPLTRKLKEELSAHFSRGGTVHNVSGELAKVAMDDRQKCFYFWQEQQKKKKRAKSEVGFDAYTATMDRAYQGLD